MTAPGYSLSSLLAPASVAVIGASDDPSRIGGRPIHYFKAGGFQGPVYPVNPKRETVQGLTAYPTIGAVPEPVDFAIVALPAGVAVEAVRACADAGVKGCVVFSSGFAEADAAGRALQDEMTRIARETGMRIVGPNCLGLFNAALGFYPTFTTTLDRGLPQTGPLSIVSQSGAYGSHLYFLARERSLGMRYWITTGNECDVQVAECLRWLADDDGTEIIMAYIEGSTDPEALIDGFERARANRKPVIMMKVGRSAVGAEAAASHTAALAGADAIYDAIFRQYGVHRARTTQELMDIAYGCTRGIYPAARKLGLVTISGGVGVLMADTAEDYGLDVTPMPEDAQRELKEALPFAAVRNPVDITAQSFNQMSLVTTNMRIMLEKGGYDAIVAFFTSVAGSTLISEKLAAALAEGCAGHPDRLLVLSIIAPPEIVARYEAQGFLVYEDPSSAIAVIAALTRFGESFARAKETPTRIAVAPPAEPLPRRTLGEAEAKRWLSAAGIPVVTETLATSADEAVAAFEGMNGPVVLKIASADILHKTEVGGVLLDRRDAGSVRAGFGTLLARAAERAPDARIDGVLVAPMVTGGVETILGVQHDPVFGPMVMFGLGGVFVEVLKDVTFRRAPFDAREARAMVDEVKGRALLDGARGAPPADIDALVRALVRLSRFAAAHAGTVETIDLNPFVVLPAGQGALALDALIVPRETG